MATLPYFDRGPEYDEPAGDAGGLDFVSDRGTSIAPPPVAPQQPEPIAQAPPNLDLPQVREPDPVEQWEGLRRRRRERAAGGMDSVGASPLAQDLEGTISALTAEHAARRRADEDRAVTQSRIGAELDAEGRSLAERVGSAFETMGRLRLPLANPFSLAAPQTNQEFAAGERAWGQRMEGVWSSAQSILDARRRAIEGGDALDPFPAVTDWLGSHVQRNIQDAQRRQLEASQIEAGLRAGPRTTFARHLYDRAGHGLMDGVVANVLKGAGYGQQFLSGENLSDVEEAGIYRAGAAISEWAKQTFPNDPARQHEFSGRLAEGFGSMVGFMGPGVAAQILARGGPLTLSLIYGGTAGVTGAAAQAGSMTDEAVAAMRQGRLVDGQPITEADVRRVFAWSLPIGGSEALPIARLFNRSGGRLAFAILAQAVEEAGQEWGQQVASNIVARLNYDDQRRWDEGAWEGLAIGGILGAGMQGTAGLTRGTQEARLGGRSTTTPPPVSPPTTAPLEPPEPAAPPTAAPTQAAPQEPAPRTPAYTEDDFYGLDQFGAVPPIAVEPCGGGSL